jgi:hypothetical protein
LLLESMGWLGWGGLAGLEYFCVAGLLGCGAVGSAAGCYVSRVVPGSCAHTLK